MRLNHRFQKIYFEYLAKLLLETFIPKEYHNLILRDKPDLQMSDEIGIEVTRVLNEEEGKASGIFERIKGKGEFDSRYKETIKNIGYELYYFEDRVVGYGPNDAVIVDNEPLKRAFLNKTVKLYDYPIIDLFMYSPMSDWFEEEKIKEFVHWTETNGGKNFRRVIICEPPCLYVFNTKNSTLNIIVMESKKRIQCIEQARQYVFSLQRKREQTD